MFSYPEIPNNDLVRKGVGADENRTSATRIASISAGVTEFVDAELIGDLGVYCMFY